MHRYKGRLVTLKIMVSSSLTCNFLLTIIDSNVLELTVQLFLDVIWSTNTQLSFDISRTRLLNVLSLIKSFHQSSCIYPILPLFLFYPSGPSDDIVVSPLNYHSHSYITSKIWVLSNVSTTSPRPVTSHLHLFSFHYIFKVWTHDPPYPNRYRLNIRTHSSRPDPF